MPKRVRLIVLCEDDCHLAFASAFLHKLALSSAPAPFFDRRGDKTQVFRAFPEQLTALRSRHAETRLIVIVDGDNLTDAQVLARLRKECRSAGLTMPDFANDPVLVIIPRWEMENWALHLLGASIGEKRNQNAKTLLNGRERDAARALANHCRSGTLPKPALPSMVKACEDWQAFRQRWKL